MQSFNELKVIIIFESLPLKMKKRIIPNIANLNCREFFTCLHDIHTKMYHNILIDDRFFYKLQNHIELIFVYVEV